MPKSSDRVKEELAQKHCFILSVLVTIFVIALSDYFNVPNPAVVCFIAVVLSTFAGGFFCGSVSGSLTILYCGYFFSEPGHLMKYTSQNFYKIFIIFITTIFMILMVGILKRQLKNRTEALEKANKQLILFSAVDWLTGIANIRSFDELLDKEWDRGLSEQISVALVLIDVDFFKNYNDSYGHQAGDECLRHALYKLLYKIYKEYHMTVIVVEHNINFLLPYATNMIVMNKGEVAAQGTFEEAAAIAYEIPELRQNLPELWQVKLALENRFGITLGAWRNEEEALKELQEKFVGGGCDD